MSRAEPRPSRRDVVQLERLRTDRRYELWTRLGSLLIGRGLKWGFFGFLVYQFRLAVEAYAGKITLAGFLVSLGANVTTNLLVSWSVAIGFGIWVFLERKLKRDTVERLSLRIKELELRIDRKRSSSDLTKRGDTRPEDQL